MQVILVFVPKFRLVFLLRRRRRRIVWPRKVTQHHKIISFTWIVQKKLYANDGMLYLPHIKYNIKPRIIRMNDIAFRENGIKLKSALCWHPAMLK